MDEKVSDLVGEANLNINKKFDLSYDFAIDQNYKELNYNDLGAKMNFGALDIDFNYTRENHIGNKDYLNKLTIITVIKPCFHLKLSKFNYQFSRILQFEL